MKIEDQIRACAARNMSKAMTMSVLGITRYKMDLLADAMPDIKWPARGRSLGEIERNASRRGYTTPAILAACERGREAMRQKRAKYTLCGITTDLASLYALWEDQICVGRHMVQTRINKGWGLYDAMFLPTQKRGPKREPRNGQ